jgi:hypothetical protein
VEDELCAGESSVKAEMLVKVIAIVQIRQTMAWSMFVAMGL